MKPSYLFFIALFGGFLALMGCEKEKTFPPISKNLTSAVASAVQQDALTTSMKVQAHFPLDGVEIPATVVIFDKTGQPIEEVSVSVKYYAFEIAGGHIGTLYFKDDPAATPSSLFLYKQSASKTGKLLILTAEAYAGAKADGTMENAVVVNADADQMARLADNTFFNWDYFPDELGVYVGAVIIDAPLPDQTHNPDVDSVLNIIQLTGNTSGGCEWDSPTYQTCPCEGVDGVDCRPSQPDGKNVTLNGIPVYSVHYGHSFTNCCRTCGSSVVSFAWADVQSMTYTILHDLGGIYGTATQMVKAPAAGNSQKTVRIIKRTATGDQLIYNKVHWTDIAGAEVLIIITSDGG